VLDKEMTVMDIVYKPLRTKLLREAEERGCRTIDGLEMLARQGAAQIEIWTGRKPEIGEIKEDLRRALNQHSAPRAGGRLGGSRLVNKSSGRSANRPYLGCFACQNRRWFLRSARLILICF